MLFAIIVGGSVLLNERSVDYSDSFNIKNDVPTKGWVSYNIVLFIVVNEMFYFPFYFLYYYVYDNWYISHYNVIGSGNRKEKGEPKTFLQKLQ